MNICSYTDKGELNPQMGYGQLITDAWGAQKVSLPKSLFHGMFTYDIPPTMWLTYEDDVEVSSSTNATSSGGALRMDTTGLSTSLEVTSRRSPRYQPNRGHLYSTSMIFPTLGNDATCDFGLFTVDNGVFFRVKPDGKLYAVLRSGGVETHEEEISTSRLSSFDLSKGNIYDIQFQWRGVGSYFFYIGDPDSGTSELVHMFKLLGTLTELSLENPALPCAYKITKGTEDAVMLSGCVDITSENGLTDNEQYGSAIGASTVSTLAPIVALFQPATISSRINTRDLRLSRISANSDKKATVSVYTTRDATALTGASFAAINSGSYAQQDTSATALDTAKCKLVTKFNVEANSNISIDNPSRETIDFFLSRGDYLIIAGTGSSATITAVIEFGEEI